MKRMPAVAGPGRFYPGSEESCRSEIEGLLEPKPAVVPEPGRAVAGIVPHAGWAYSGRTALSVFWNLRSKSAPATFILFGFSHMGGVDRVTLSPGDSWSTPLGEALVDEALGELLLKGLGAQGRTDARPHEREHSIEVQVPFIQYFWPAARIVPVLVPALGAEARKAGERIGELVIAAGRADVVAVGTTDLTHYGPSYGFAPRGVGKAALDWVRNENDASMVRAMVEMRAEDIELEARSRRNACGPGAAAATVAYARARGATKGVLVDYTTSHDVIPGGPPSTFVGYAGILF